jgi:preprotein translocase subunit SecG
MTIAIGFLTFLLILIALFLILLVLVQLPKKEAGVGMAFGAGMSEMLLGAGSGNVLTRITKYSVGIFLGLSLIVSVLLSSHYRSSGLNVSRALEEKARAAQALPAAQPPVNSGLQPMLSSTNDTPALMSTTTVVNPTPAVTPAPTPVPAATTPDTNKPAAN